tara:strand:- start:1206 stop:1349 length:144 start_codon:yes stop_codon:yes gene_type:complete
LVRLKDKRWDSLGIIVDIVINAKVLWSNSEYIYVEPIERLEVVNENR